MRNFDGIRRVKIQLAKPVVKKTIAWASVAGLVFSLFVFVAPRASVQADLSNINFENPPYTSGVIDGQDGWSSVGAAGGGCALYDHEVDSSLGTTGFGSQSLRVSNAVTSGCFGDQTFSKSLTDEAGETSAANDGKSGGTRESHFEAQFSIASTIPDSQQVGLAVSVSPDRGDGARMSYVRFEDQADGIHVLFSEFKDLAPFGVSLPDANGCGVEDDFFETDIATLDRSETHTVKFDMDFVDGTRNDVVKVYIDSVLEITGTSWEDYFRYCEGNPTRTVDSLIFRSGGTAFPDNAGKGFLFDNLSLQSGEVEVVDETCTTSTLVSDTSTQFKGLTTTPPAGSSSDALFTTGTAGAAVVAAPTGFPGAWDAASADPDVTGASWVNNSADQPNNPADGNPGGDGTIDTWRLFSDTFTIPAGATSISSPVLHFTSDNSVEAFLDNVSVGTSSDFATVADTAPLTLTTGAHELEFVVKNDAYQGLDNPTGLLYKMTVEYCEPNTPPASGEINGSKFFDMNANGVWDSGLGEPALSGWTINLAGAATDSDITNGSGVYGFDELAAGNYTVSEVLQTGWTQTKSPGPITLDEGEVLDDQDFGNSCFVTTNGKSKGFWTNKNGQALLTDGDFTALNTLHLRKATGADQDFTGTLAAKKTALNTWLSAAAATNMSYMLSAQLAAVKLSVLHNFTDPDALVLAPGLLPYPSSGVNDLGFISVSNLIAAADSALTADGLTLAGDINRAYQEALKNVLDRVANGNSIQLCEVVVDQTTTFTATDSLYYNGLTNADPLYGNGPITFTWDTATGNVTGGLYEEIVPPTSGTHYFNNVVSGTVVGTAVNLTFQRTNPNAYGPFTFTGTLVGNTLTGTLDGPYLFTATGTVTP